VALLDRGKIRIDVDGGALKTAIEQVDCAAAPGDTRPVRAGVLLRLDTGQLTSIIRTSDRLPSVENVVPM
jgi:DNA polymerase III sliding clamp (beta) subunit (PCNA family)